MEQISGFLKEENGNKSCIRLMSFISLFASMAFGYVTLVMPNENTDGQTGLIITLMFLLGAFAPKAVQKLAETKLSEYNE